MELTFAPRGILQIDDARICFKNFRGEAGPYNNKGDRSFSVVIPDQETAEAMQNNTNEYGVGWNVKIKAPREEGDAPFMHMKVKVAYTDRSQPRITLVSGDNRVELNEETVGMLDDIDIRSVDMDIRPYDGDGHYGPHRTAYLQKLVVVQNLDRFDKRFDEGYYN